MRYTYDAFTQLRSSIDMPKEWVLLLVNVFAAFKGLISEPG